jgi:hypothetical protein
VAKHSKLAFNTFRLRLDSTHMKLSVLIDEAIKTTDTSFAG